MEELKSFWLKKVYEDADGNLVPNEAVDGTDEVDVDRVDRRLNDDDDDDDDDDHHDDDDDVVDGLRSDWGLPNSLSISEMSPYGPVSAAQQSGLQPYAEQPWNMPYPAELRQAATQYIEPPMDGTSFQGWSY